MKVAVASADGVNISHHFGRSKCFLVFDVEDSKVGEAEARPNTHTAHARGECDGHHDRPHCHAGIVAALSDCEAVVCHGMGWRAAEELGQHGIKPYVVDEQLTPREAVERLVNGTLNPASGFCHDHQ